MKHTPGPWHVGNEQDYQVDRYVKRAEWARIRGTDGGLVAKVESVHPTGKRQSTDFDVEHANANLIAAAPELLAACRDALFVLENITSLDFSNGGDAKVRKIIRDAIAKAEGGA